MRPNSLIDWAWPGGLRSKHHPQLVSIFLVHSSRPRKHKQLCPDTLKILKLSNLRVYLLQFSAVSLLNWPSAGEDYNIQSPSIYITLSRITLLSLRMVKNKIKSIAANKISQPQVITANRCTKVSWWWIPHRQYVPWLSPEYRRRWPGCPSAMLSIGGHLVLASG